MVTHDWTRVRRADLNVCQFSLGQSQRDGQFFITY
jgi:hypothetical protein